MTAIQHADLDLATQIQYADPFQSICPLPEGAGTFDCSPRLPLSFVSASIGSHLRMAELGLLIPGMPAL